MKKIMFITLMIALAVGIAFAQSPEEVEKEYRKVIVQMKNDMSDIPDIPLPPKMVMKIDTNMGGAPEAPDAPYMGVFVDDLSFPKAQELGYKGNVGVIITGVVSDSPAWNHRLQEDDIIVSMNGKEVSNNAVFDKMRKLYRAGDTVALEIFRTGEVIKMDFTFGSRQQKTPVPEGEKSDKPKKLSPGYGGGSWFPLWFTCEMDDVNHLLSGMGFAKLNDEGILMQGGGGKGHIGKGFFIGGAGYSYSSQDKVPDSTDPSYHLWMHYDNTFGGVTLDKRVPITKNLIGSVGFLLGGGGHTLEVMKNNSNYNWESWDATFLNSQNNHSKIRRSYLLVQPKAEVLVRLLSWMGIRGEAGYVYGYSPSKGWKVEGVNNETIDIKQSPDTEYQGLSFSVGPWFGF